MSQIEITKLLKENPKGLTAYELAERTGHHIGTIQINLKGMKKWNELDWTNDWKPKYTLKVVSE